MEGTSLDLSAGFAGNKGKPADVAAQKEKLLKKTAEKHGVDLKKLTETFERRRRAVEWARDQGDVDTEYSLEELVNHALKVLMGQLATPIKPAIQPQTEEKQWWREAWNAIQQGPQFPILKTLEKLLPHLTEEHQKEYAERLKSFGDPAATLFGILSEFSGSLQKTKTLHEKVKELFARKMTDRERVAAHEWIAMKNSDLRLDDEEAYIRGLMATPRVVLEMLKYVKRMCPSPDILQVKSPEELSKEKSTAALPAVLQGRLSPENFGEEIKQVASRCSRASITEEEGEEEEGEEGEEEEEEEGDEEGEACNFEPAQRRLNSKTSNQFNEGWFLRLDEKVDEEEERKKTEEAEELEEEANFLAFERAKRKNENFTPAEFETCLSEVLLELEVQKKYRDREGFTVYDLRDPPDDDEDEDFCCPPPEECLANVGPEGEDGSDEPYDLDEELRKLDPNLSNRARQEATRALREQGSFVYSDSEPEDSEEDD